MRQMTIVESAKAYEAWLRERLGKELVAADLRTKHHMLTNFFRTIPASMIEAAVIDGASSWRVFRRIVLPLSAAPLVTLGVVNLLWVWNELLIALVFLQDDSKKTLMVGITGFQSRYSLNVPAIMAGLTLATLPIVTVYIFGQRYFVRGLVAGALKGE